MTVPNFQALASNAPTSLPGPAVTFADLKRALLNHWQIFGLTVLGIVALVTVYVFQLPNVYTSTCTIQVDRKISAPVKIDKEVPSGGADSPQAITEFMRSQQRILTSRAIAERVIKRLALLENQDFNPKYRGLSVYLKTFISIRSLFISPEDASEMTLGDPDDPLNPPLTHIVTGKQIGRAHV